jgi:hypothetical protein
MSAGKFNKVRYQTDAGVLVRIRVQPETLEAVFGGAINSSPAGTPDSTYPSALVSGSKRSIGIHPRFVTIFFTGDAPAGYKPEQTYRIPCLNTLAFESASEGGQANYLGKPGQVVSKTKENIK